MAGPLNRRRVRVAVGILAGVVVIGVVVTARRLADGGRVTEVGVEEALERFRVDPAALPTATAAAAPPTTPAGESSTSVAALAPVASAPAEPPTELPAPGVYSYATTGFDSVDVLTGARHEYPAVTTMTVRPHDCGVEIRWDVAVERWDSFQWCMEASAIRLVRWTAFHEFFGVAQERYYECIGDPRPLDADPGTTWDLVCRAGDDVSATRSTVVERTVLDIAGERVDALHVVHDVAVSGPSTGSHRVESWYRRSDGLVLREVVTISTVQDTPVGRSAFEERSTIELLTPVPEV